MRKLLSLLPLFLAVPVVPETDFNLEKSASETYFHHLEQSRDFVRFHDDHISACVELGKAVKVLQTRFPEIQQEEPDLDWYEMLEDTKSLYEDSNC